MSFVCSVPKCSDKHHARGLCQSHYNEYVRRSAHDSFARQNAARAWSAAMDADRRLTGILERLEKIERQTTHARYLRNCHYCGAPTLDVACRNHWDLLDADPLAPTRASGG